MARSDRDDRRVKELQGKGVVTVSYERPWELFPSSQFAHSWVAGTCPYAEGPSASCLQGPHMLPVWNIPPRHSVPPSVSLWPDMPFHSAKTLKSGNALRIVTRVHVSMPRMHRSDLEVRSLEVVISTTASPTPFNCVYCWNHLLIRVYK